MSSSDTHRDQHEAFNRRDWDALAAILAPECEYTDVARNITLKGREQFIHYLRSGWTTAFSDVAATNARYTEAGDTSVARFNGTARCRPPDAR